MWPSLVQSATTSARKSRARELLDWARAEEAEDGLRALVSHGEEEGDADEETTKTKSRMQREMEELERWLEEEDAGRRKMDDAAAWGAPTPGDAWADVPTPTVRTPGAGGEVTFGFEDDFAEFVGAPIEVSYDHQPRHDTVAVDVAGGDHGGLSAQHTGASYRTLASGSEFGGSDVFGEETENDPDLPSRAEIEETSRRIFGGSLDVPSITTSRSPGKTKEGVSLPGSSSSVLAGGEVQHTGTEEHEHEDVAYRPLDDDSFDADDDDDYELGAFDLSRVLGALQGMKEEIAGMQDEDERRRAAARVALGLVYGLQKEDERVRDGGAH